MSVVVSGPAEITRDWTCLGTGHGVFGYTATASEIAVLNESMAQVDVYTKR